MKKIKIRLFTLLLLSSCTNSEVINRYENGQVKLECSLNNNGLRDGRCTHYFSNGNVKSINQFENDTLNGVSKYFHENGLLSWSVHYDYGLKNGNVKYYDSLGNIYQSLFFKENKPHGKNYTYYPNGEIKDELIYNEGIPIGVHSTYFKNGNIGRKVTLNNNGELIDYVKFDSLGNVVSSFLKLKYFIKKNNTSYKLKMKIDNQIGNQIHVVIGHFDSKKENLTDTLAIQSNNGDEIMIALIRSELKEDSIISGKIYDLEIISDTNAVIKGHRKFKFDLKNNKEMFYEFY